MLDYQGPFSPLMSTNSSSILKNLSIVKQKISDELNLSRIAGPFNAPPFENFKVSPLSLREKSTPGKYRIIHNLSYPYNENSVNFHIPEKFSKVTYEHLSDALNLIQPDAWLAKTDIADAFRLIPLHPSQYSLTGFHLENSFYFDKCLPQGCSSSCRIFERFSSALKWMFLQNQPNVKVVKVLDDFLFIAATQQDCLIVLTNFLNLCKTIGVPIAEHKTEHPTKCLTFLGIELNTKLMIARLPMEKLTKYRAHTEELVNSSKCTLRELKSLIGKLQFSTSVITSGRPFLRRLHDATIGIKHAHHYVRINGHIKQDLMIWIEFLKHYNGKTIITEKLSFTSYELNLYSDSSKTGFGGIYKKNYISGLFPKSWYNFDIQFLELYPIFLLVNIFKKELRNKTIIFHCDNSSVVSALNTQTSRNKMIMMLIRPLILIFLNNNIHFSSVHIPGNINILCDQLSRQQMTQEVLLYHGMNLHPTVIPNYLRPHNFNLNY